MRIAVTLLAVVAWVAGMPAGPANANSDPLAPREFLARPHVDRDADADFTYSSRIISNDGSLATAEYVICNRESRELIYSWKGPNVRRAVARSRLPGGECDVARRDPCSVEHDYEALILYTQAWRPLVAAAHVPPYFCRFTARELKNGTKRLLFGEEWTTPRTAALELEVTQMLTDTGVRHIVRWQPPEISVVLSTEAFPGQEAETVAAALNDAGHEARTEVLSDILRPVDREIVAAEHLDDTVIVLMPNYTGEAVDFRTSIRPDSIVSATARAIHPDFGLLFEMEISAFGE